MKRKRFFQCGGSASGPLQVTNILRIRIQKTQKNTDPMRHSVGVGGGGTGGGGEDIGKARCTWELEAAFNRFKFLLAHLRFDDATIREEARLQDKFAPARWAWSFMRQPADNILNIFYLSLVRSWPSSTEHVLVQCSVGKASQWTRPFTPTRVGGLASGKSKSE